MSSGGPIAPPPTTRDPRAPERPRAGRAAPGGPGARVWTILDLLRWTQEHFTARGIETARLDAECLLAHALSVERLRLYLDFDKPVNESERAVFRELVRRRAGDRVPVAQLLGEREFWSLTLRVNRHVLSPRPETETLVEAALAHFPDPEAPIRILEIGTGSGAVALALARERPRAVTTATDISQEALKIAQHNAEALGMADRIRFRAGDLFAPALEEMGEAGPAYDLVVSNPPYVGESERAGLAPELAHEPEIALFAGEDGLAVLRRLAHGVAAVLAPQGVVAFELAPAQAPVVAGWLREVGLEDVAIHRDLARRPRVVSGRGGGGREPADGNQRTGTKKRG